jgi:hypothetical protein
MRSDAERTAAHRVELRRAIATLEVKILRLKELQDVVSKLNADSEAAAEEHAIAAGKLQAELDSLDRQQVDAVMAGKPTPAEVIARRVQILDELAEANRRLEARCEGNRRAAAPFGEQTINLARETAGINSLRNKLVDLCSDDTRRRIAFNEMKIQMASAGAKEASRRAAHIDHNLKLHLRQKQTRDAEIETVRLADAKALVESMQAEIVALQAESERLREVALAE